MITQDKLIITASVGVRVTVKAVTILVFWGRTNCISVCGISDFWYLS